MASKKNTRVFYASHDVAVFNDASTDGLYEGIMGNLGGGVIQGAQSVGIDTSFGSEDQLFQLGRLEAYDSTLTAPEVQISLTKSLDGWPLIWHHQAGSISNAKLLDIINAKSTVDLTVGNDTDEFIQENAIHADNKCNGGATINMTGCFMTSFSYTFGDGVFSEEIGLLGNSKSITDINNDAPINAPLGNTLPANGNVLSRQNFRKPHTVAGVVINDDDGIHSVYPDLIKNEKVSTVTVSGDLSSEPLYELGSFYSVDRQSPLPVNITVEFDVIADTHDCVGVAIQQVAECASPTGLTGKDHIILRLCNSDGSTVYEFNFDTSAGDPTAKLNSVSYSGGDTGGGNVTIKYTYIVANTLNIKYLNPANLTGL